MKKFIIYISLIISFVVIYLLQSTFFTNFTIAGVMPNIIVILVLYIGLYAGVSKGIIFGIMFGIFIDIWIGKNIGITSICLATVGILGGMFDKNFSKDSRITILLMVISCTIIYEIAISILQYIVLNTNIEILEFIKILLIEVVYNTLITIILYPLIKNTGYEIENEIKGDKIFLSVPEKSYHHIIYHSIDVASWQSNFILLSFNHLLMYLTNA